MAGAKLHQRDKLLRYALGELSAEDSAEFQAHLAGCESCDDFVAFVQKFNAGLRAARSEILIPGEGHPDSSLVVALADGDLAEDIAERVSTHLLFCESCMEEFLCFRSLSDAEPWSLIESLRDSLIDLGKMYGAGAIRGLAQITSESPALAVRGEAATDGGSFKTFELVVGNNRYSIELRVTEDESLTCDIAGIEILTKEPVTVFVRSETGEEIGRTVSDNFGNAQMSISESSLQSDLYVLTVALKNNEQSVLFRLPDD